jgi:hypothetical protein
MSDAGCLNGWNPSLCDARAGLSEPFQRGVPTLFTPEFSAGRMLAVLDRIDTDRSGGFFDWDGKAVPW